MHPVMNDVNKNLAKMKGFIESTMAEKPETDLIVFPELALTGYECGTAFQDLAEVAEDGKSIEFMKQLAKSHKVHLIFGFPQRDPKMKDVIYNSSILIDDEGVTLGTYQKVHPFAGEIMYFRPGCTYPIIETKIGKIGMMICWDTAFPEVARTYALKGADLLVVSSNWEKPYSHDWDLVTSARAFDNCMYLAASNRIGPDKDLDFFGHSRICDHLGDVIVSIDEEKEGTISAELDYSIPLKRRAEYYTFFKDRRPDTYGSIVEEY
jgi:predicted amidohydrolase